MGFILSLPSKKLNLVCLLLFWSQTEKCKDISRPLAIKDLNLFVQKIEIISEDLNNIAIKDGNSINQTKTFVIENRDICPSPYILFKGLFIKLFL